MRIRVFSPVGVLHVDPDGPREVSAIPSLREGVIGIVDNTKPNAVDLMGSVANRFAETVSGLHVIVERKNSASEGMSDTAFGKLSQEASVVLVGSGD